MGELSYQVSQWLIQEGYTVVRWSAGWDKMQRGDIVLLHEQDPIADLPKKLERLEEILGYL